MKRIVVPPGSEMYPWVIASTLIAKATPEGSAIRTRMEYLLDIAAMAHDDALHDRRKKRKPEAQP